MATPMAVNFVNVFMGRSERRMLQDYERIYDRKPTAWLRYIDDVLLLWNGDEISLKAFIRFCNRYATNNNMKSNIKFTSHCSKTHVTFLDTKVKLKDGKLVTELYTKPSAFFPYLHRTSDHPPHTFKTITKSQFIKICRICRTLDGHWVHATKVMSFFKSCGFNEMTVNKKAKEIAEKSHSDFFPGNDGTLTELLKHMGKSARVPFVTTWRHKRSGFQNSLHYHHKEMINNFPNLKSVFPVHPILSYCRNQNLCNLLVCSSFNRPPPCHTASNSSPYQKSRCKLCRLMSNSNSILNTQSEKTCYTSGGQYTTTNTIYAAECIQHKLIYLGQSSQKINMRFNGHQSDVNVKTKAFELARHFHGSHECNIKKDLKVYILQDIVIGSLEIPPWNEDQSQTLC